MADTMQDITRLSPEVRRKVRIRWVIVTLLVIGGVVNYLDRGNLSIANTTIAAEFHLNDIEMGLLLSAFSWPYAIANLPAGYLIDKFGPKRLFGWAMALWSAVSMLSAVASSFGVFYAFRVALGLAESPFFAAGLKVTDRWFRKEERSMPVSVVNTGSQIGNALVPPLLTFLLLALTWRGMFLVIGVLGVVVLLVWLKVYRDPTPEQQALIKARESDIDKTVETASAKVSWRRLFSHQNTYFMIIGCFGIFYTNWVYITWLPSYLETARHLSIALTGWLAALPFACGIIGVVFGGWVAKRLVRRGVNVILSRKIPIVGGAILAAAAVLPVAFIGNTSVAILLLSIGYFGTEVPIGCIWTLAADVAEHSEVASLGSVQNFGGYLGATLAPLLTGIILTETGGNFALVFIVGAIALVIGAVSYGFFVKDRSQTTVPAAGGTA